MIPDDSKLPLLNYLCMYCGTRNQDTHCSGCHRDFTVEEIQQMGRASR